MFDEIKKITTNIEYDNSRSPSYRVYHLKKAYIKKIGEQDSIDFSPTIVFLNKINWRIKKLKYESKEKINILFEADKFEIQTSLDLLKLDETSTLDYNITKPIHSVSKDYNMLANFSIILKKINYYEEFILKDLVFLNLLFEKFINLNVKDELNKRDSVVLNSLFEEFEPELSEEFDFINNSLFIFLKKLTGYKKNSGGEKHELLFDPILINKIKVVNGELI